MASRCGGPSLSSGLVRSFVFLLRCHSRREEVRDEHSQLEEHAPYLGGELDVKFEQAMIPPTGKTKLHFILFAFHEATTLGAEPSRP